MTAPLEISTEAAAPESVLEGVGSQAIEGRSLGQIAWLRLRRDKVAIAGGVVVILLILLAIFGPFFVQNPNIYHAEPHQPDVQRPNGPFGGISMAHPLGVEPLTGRDMLAPSRDRRAVLAADRRSWRPRSRWCSAWSWASSPATSAAGSTR